MAYLEYEELGALVELIERGQRQAILELLQKKLNFLNTRISKLNKGSKRYDYYMAQRHLIKGMLNDLKKDGSQ